MALTLNFISILYNYVDLVRAGDFNILKKSFEPDEDFFLYEFSVIALKV